MSYKRQKGTRKDFDPQEWWGMRRFGRHQKPPWGPRRFRSDWHNKRRFLFFRFVWFFGMAVLLFLAGMAGLAFLLTRLFGGDGQATALVWVLGCGLALAFPLLAGAIAIRSFRSMVNPLARVMAAADEVAEGDFSVRVPERGSGEFGRLARSFNRMVAELERADQQRRNLTADVAHELRTPIHIIQGNLEGIADGVYEPTDEQIELLIDETQQLSRLVEDLRTLSLAEAGQLQLELEQLDANELLSDVATSFSGQAEAAEVEIQLDFEQEYGPIIILGDAGRLDQVVSNLVANAINHTQPGGVIKLRAWADQENAFIQVMDDGHGIPAEDLPYIFDRFWRGEGSRESSSGLGLAIARQLLQAHGGNISVESEQHVGTTFTIDLPK
jgi:two-component system OmpR family sensor kinase/two-component system sensor histidine kinase BaeS